MAPPQATAEVLMVGQHPTESRVRAREGLGRAFYLLESLLASTFLPLQVVAKLISAMPRCVWMRLWGGNGVLGHDA